MDIQKYACWFHDGDLKKIHHNKEKGIMAIEMSSSPIIDWDEFDEMIQLKNDRTINGILHINGIQSITINDSIFDGTLKMLYEDGEILDFDFGEDNEVSLGIMWTSYEQSKTKSDYSYITIRASNIDWENLPIEVV